MFAVIAHQDIGSFASKGERHGAADTAITTGDDDLLVLEAPSAPVALFTVVGRRIHQVALSGHRLLLLRKGWFWKWAAHRLFLHWIRRGLKSLACIFSSLVHT